MRRKAIIVDWDGVLTNKTWRAHMCFKKAREEQRKPTKEEYKRFHSLSHIDSINEWCRELVESFKSKGFAIILISGRPSKYMQESRKWLSKNGFEFDEVFLKEEGTEEVPTAECKNIIYNKYIKDTYDVIFVVEDRKSNCDMWRANNLICLQSCDDCD